MNLFDAVGRVERLHMLSRHLSARLGVVVERILATSMKPVEIDVLVQRTRSSQNVVGRIYGECLHRGTNILFTVAVWVACIERSVVMEESLAINACDKACQ